MNHFWNWLFHTVQYGDVTSWIESTSTGAAFLIVALTYRGQVNDKRREQASNIDFILWAGDSGSILVDSHGNRMAPLEWPMMVLGREPTDYGQLYLTVFNGNGNAINDVIVHTPMAESGVQFVSLGKVPPGEHVCYYSVLDPDATGEPKFRNSTLVPFIQFRDGSGRFWQRSAYGDLVEIRASKRNKVETGRRAQLN